MPNPDGSPTTAELLASLQHKEKLTPSEIKARSELAATNQVEEETRGRTKLFALRGYWSLYLMALLLGTAIVQAFIIFKVGTGTLKFENHEVFLNVSSSELFLQIAGMGYIVVRCLFPSDEMSKGKKDGPTPSVRKGKPAAKQPADD